MSARGYQNYHGKKSGKRILLVVVLALVLVLAAAFLVLQDYIVYESDGSIRLDLPFLEQQEDGQMPEGSGDPLPIEIIEPEEPAPTGEAGFTVKEVSLYDLWEADSLDTASGNQGLVTEVKGPDGTFYYQSDWAAEGAADDRAVSRTGVADLLEGPRNWSAVAAIHCFRDDYYAMADMEGAGICQRTGYIWFGLDNAHWLEPAKEGTKAYLCAVAEECREMGFDEVLLRSFGDPTRGNLDKIDYSSRQISKEEALETFLEAMRETLGEDVLLSVELTAEQVLSGPDGVSGVDPAGLAALVDRVYVTGSRDRDVLEDALAVVLGEVPAGFLVLEDQ